MCIRYLLLDNGIEFEDDVCVAGRWAELKPKTVCIKHLRETQL